MDKLIYQEAFSLLKKDFDLPEGPTVFTEDEAICILTKAVEMLLNRDFVRLLQLCYRVDLGEHLLKKILNEAEPDLISRELAKALWQRQKQKAELRRRYSG